ADMLYWDARSARLFFRNSASARVSDMLMLSFVCENDGQESTKEKNNTIYFFIILVFDEQDAACCIFSGNVIIHGYPSLLMSKWNAITPGFPEAY
ncbi:MAG TPA: hypothetical protein PLL71_09975, partial [Agriterribacter sp.]|nr:hypothetical protein [Agriterribacter sp.]